jgi:hypothetical protein
VAEFRLHLGHHLRVFLCILNQSFDVLAVHGCASLVRRTIFLKVDRPVRERKIVLKWGLAMTVISKRLDDKT